MIKRSEQDETDESFYNEDRATIVIVDRSIDWQTILVNDYSYMSNIFMTHSIP